MPYRFVPCAQPATTLVHAKRNRAVAPSGSWLPRRLADGDVASMVGQRHEVLMKLWATGPRRDVGMRCRETGYLSDWPASPFRAGPRRGPRAASIAKIAHALGTTTFENVELATCRVPSR